MGTVNPSMRHISCTVSRKNDKILKNHGLRIDEMARRRRTIRRGFRRINEAKRNPNSIRKLFFDYIDRAHRGNQVIASEAFARFVRDTAKEEGSSATYRGQTISRTTLTKINTDSTFIQYWHLELLARMIGIPIGFMLLYTRMQSNTVSTSQRRRFENEVIARTAVTVFGDFLEDLEARRKSGRVEEFIEIELLQSWVEEYKKITKECEEKYSLD